MMNADRPGRPLGPALLVTAVMMLLSCLVMPLAAQETLHESSAPDAAAPSDAERVRHIIEEAMRSRHAVGLSVAIARGEEMILADGFGLADVEHDVPVTDETIFRIASLTKQFTAAMIMKLVEQDRLTLDDELTKYVEYPTGEHTVAIRHLLNHTSGIPSYTGVGLFWKEGAPCELTHEELLAFVKDQPFDFVPGEQYRYSNTGYYLLGMVIETVTGRSYGEALTELICDPLGLEHTRYQSHRKIIPHRACGYGVERGALANALHLSASTPGGAGGIISTARDLVRWQRALAAGKVVSAASYEQMITPTMLTDGSMHPYGFGLVISKLGDQPLIGHAGGIFGFSTSLLYLPEANLHVAVLSNCEALPAEPIGLRIVRALLEASESEEKHEAGETDD